MMSIKTVTKHFRKKSPPVFAGGDIFLSGEYTCGTAGDGDRLFHCFGGNAKEVPLGGDITDGFIAALGSCFFCDFPIGISDRGRNAGYGAGGRAAGIGKGGAQRCLPNFSTAFTTVNNTFLPAFGVGGSRCRAFCYCADLQIGAILKINNLRRFCRAYCRSRKATENCA